MTAAEILHRHPLKSQKHPQAQPALANPQEKQRFLLSCPQQAGSATEAGEANPHFLTCKLMNGERTVPVSNCVHKILVTEVIKPVALSFESKHRVRPEPNTAVHPWGKMNTQKRIPGIRHLQE